MPNIGFIHPSVKKRLDKYKKISLCLEGEDSVKKAGQQFLPMPETSNDATENLKNYEKYKLRANFYAVSRRTVEGLVGQVFSKPVACDCPSEFDILIDDIDGAGSTLEQQAKRSLENVISFGRAGLLVDAPTIGAGEVVTKADIETGKIRPRVILYEKDQIINWRETNVGGKTMLSKLVLKEGEMVDVDGFEFEYQDRWRLYELDDSGNVNVSTWKLKSDAGAQGENSEDYEMIGEVIAILDSAGNPVQEIPFAFIGSTNNDSTVDDSPIESLVDLNFAHYRNSADYEQSLFIIGPPTLVLTGLNQSWVDHNLKGGVRLGSANGIFLPENGTASILQPSPNSQAFEGMTHKEKQMKAIGAKLIEPNSTERTATETEIEETSDASVLSSAAKNVSSAYEKAMFFTTFFTGSETDVEKINVALNSEFQILGLNATERAEVVAAHLGGILAFPEVREVYRKRGIATLSDDDARTLIDQEMALAEPSEPAGDE